MHRTLVIAISRMGDLVQSGPFLRRLKRRCPETELHILVEECFADVARMLPGVDKIHAVKLEYLLPALGSGPNHDLRFAIEHYRRYLDELRSFNFTSTWNLTHTRPATVLNFLLAGSAGNGVTLDEQGLQRVNSSWLRYFFATNLARPWCQFNLVDIYANCVDLAEWHAERSPSLLTQGHGSVQEFLPPRAVGTARIAIHPGASQRSKCWPLESYVELSRMLQQALRAEIVVIGGPRDHDLARPFVEQGAVSLIGKTSVPQLATILRSCDLLITNDSGPMHVAAAVGTRVLALTVGTALASETAPYGEGHIAIEPVMPCFPCPPLRPCTTSTCAATIATDLVFDLARAALTGETPTTEQSAAARVYRTFVNPKDGLLDLEPLTSAARDERCRLNQTMRSAWLRGLEPRFADWPASKLLENVTAESLSQAFTAVHSARLAAIELQQAAQQETIPIARCQALGNAIEQSEQQLTRLLEAAGPLAAVLSYHQLARGSLTGKSLFEQSAETVNIYNWLERMLSSLMPSNSKLANHSRVFNLT